MYPQGFFIRGDVMEHLKRALGFPPCVSMLPARVGAG